MTDDRPLFRPTYADGTVPERNLVSRGVLLDEGGRVLLVNADYGDRDWWLPGGLVERGESPLDAVVREFQEEVSLRVRVSHLITMSHRHQRGVEWLNFLFAVQCVDPELGPVANPGELSAIGWFSEDGLPEPMRRSTREAIAAGVSRQRGLCGVEKEG